MKSLPTHQQVNYLTLELGFEAWLKANCRHGNGGAENSIGSYLSDIRVFYRWFQDHTMDPFPTGLMNADLRQYCDHSIKVEGCKASTWNRRRISISHFCRFCVAVGYLSENPFYGIRAMKKQKRAPKSPSQTEFRLFMRRAEQIALASKTEKQRYLATRNLAIIAMLAYAGLREGEVCELAPSDLLLTDRKSQIAVRDGKGNLESTAYLSLEGRHLITNWLAIRTDNEKLFEGITTRQVQRIVADIAGVADLDWITPHCLRHYFVYRVRETTGDIQKAQHLARHSSIRQTLDYALPHADDLQAAADLVSF